MSLKFNGVKGWGRISYTIDLSGRVALITGAAKGIGLSTALLLARAGAQLVLDDLVPAEKITKELELIKKENAEAEPHYFCQDVSNPEGAGILIEQALACCGRIDFLINNAGVVADWDKSWAVHVKGPYYMAEAVKEHMARRGSGRIVNISSTAAFTGSTGIPEYAVSKGGTCSLTRYLARTYAPLGILVNGIAPAVIKSDMLMARYKDEQELLEHYIPMMPVRRIGYPEDIARIVLFLCSELSSYLCGEIIVADGGRMYVG